MDFVRELLVAETLARHSGTIALNLRKQLTISQKLFNQGPVTNADIEIDTYICKELRKEFPDDRIISEESYQESEEDIGNGRVWFVDPIDGTKSYIFGSDDFVTMIGLAIDGEPRLGVVYQPTHDCLWRGINATKSFSEKITSKGRSLLQAQKKPKHLTSLNLLASKTHSSSKQDSLIKRLRPKEVILKSSVGLKAMMVLEKGANLYVGWSKYIKLWDTCAADAIVKAAYGTMILLDKTQLLYNRGISHNYPIVCANFPLDNELFNTLRDIEKFSK